MKNSRFFSIFLVLFLLSTFLLAAEQDGQLQNSERLRENILTLRLIRMTQILDLTEEQTAKIYPVLNRIEKDKIKIQRQIGQGIKQLKLMLQEEKPESDKIANEVKKIKDQGSLIKQRDEELESFLENNLTLIQRAKYLLFSVEFYSGLGEKLQRSKIMPDKLLLKKERN